MIGGSVGWEWDGLHSGGSRILYALFEGKDDSLKNGVRFG